MIDFIIINITVTIISLLLSSLKIGANVNLGFGDKNCSPNPNQTQILWFFSNLTQKKKQKKKKKSIINNLTRCSIIPNSLSNQRRKIISYGDGGAGRRRNQVPVSWCGREVCVRLEQLLAML